MSGNLSAVASAAFWEGVASTLALVGFLGLCAVVLRASLKEGGQ